MFCKFVISVRGGHRDCPPWASENLATPLTVIPLPVPFILNFFF